MLLILLLASIVISIALYFYKRKQIEALNDQIQDKDSIILALRGHIQSTEDTRISEKPIQQNANSEKKLLQETPVNTNPSKKKRYYRKNTGGSNNTNTQGNKKPVKQTKSKQ